MRKIFVLFSLLSLMAVSASQPAHADRVVASTIVGSGPVALAFNPSNNFMYVANYYSSSVSVLSGTTVVANIAVSAYPDALAFDPANNEVYVASRLPSPSPVAVISGTTQIANVTTYGYGANAITFNPSNDEIYVANSNSGTVSVISGTSLIANVYVGGSPAAMAFNPANNDMYVALQGCCIGQNGEGSGVVAVISETSLVARVSVGYEPSALVFNPADNHMYVATRGYSGPSIVSVISGITNVANVTVGGSIRGLAFDPADNEVYATSYGVSVAYEYGNVTVISGASVIANVRVESGPGALLYNPINKEIYAANELSNSVSIISGTTLVANTETGAGPDALAYNPSNNDVYVANRDSNTVSIIRPGPSHPDFMISAVPNWVSMGTNSTGNATIVLTDLDGFTGRVALTINTSPSTGLACVLSQTETSLGRAVTSDTVTLWCSGSAGYYNVTVTGTSRNLSHSAILTVFVNPTIPDFLFSPVNPVSLYSGSPATSLVLVSFWNGFSEPVALSSSASPTNGLSISLTPQTIDCGSFCSSGTSTATFNSSTPGSYTVTITGVSGGLTHSVTVRVTVLQQPSH